MLEIEHGDMRAVLATLPENSLDSCVTDPPYHLTSTAGGKRGFMGKEWDGGRVAMEAETWAQVYRVLKPGAYLAAFGGTRTWHRIAVAIEDAGFEIRDSLAWLQSQGMPKSLNVGGGVGTALRPCFEPIILARKPLIGTVAANMAAHGTGGINIDACRIPGVVQVNKAVRPEGEEGMFGIPSRTFAGFSDAGRWPPNVMCDEDIAADLDATYGERKSGKAVTRHGGGGKIFNGENGGARPDGGYSDSGVSRFFYCPKANKKEKNEGLDHWPLLSAEEITGRADGEAPGTKNGRAGAGHGGGMRNPHVTIKPLELMRWLARLVTPPGGFIVDPFAGSGTTGCAAALEGFHFIGVELDETHARLCRDRIAYWAARAAEGKAA